MKKISLMLCFFFAAANSKIVIISFSNEECERLGFGYINHLSEKAKSLVPLNCLGMLIVDIDLLALTKFMSQFKSFQDCVNGIEEDKHFSVEFTMPQEHTDTQNMRDQWQLKRINVSSLPLPDNAERRISSMNAAHVIMIDSGIDARHPDLSSRIADISEHFSFVENDSCCANKNDPLCDCLDSGTENSGLVASPKAGYNPNAILHSIKIINAEGETTVGVIIQAMDKAIEISRLHPGEIYIANMTCDVPFDAQINQAVEKLVQAGIFFVASAGNNLRDACLASPGSSLAAFTVGASEINDTMAFFSNYGACVDIFAPGIMVNSCQPGGGYAPCFGTGISSSLIAGFASAIAAAERLTDPNDIRDAVNRHVTKNAVTYAKTNNNNLPYDGNNGNADFLEEHKIALS